LKFCWGGFVNKPGSAVQLTAGKREQILLETKSEQGRFSAAVVNKKAKFRQGVERKIMTVG